MPVRVLLVDDHAVLREGLRHLLASDRIEIVGEAGSGLEALRLAKRLQPDVAILDVTLPELNGLEITRRLARESPRTRAIVLTMHREEAYVLEALRAGAAGFVLKSQAFADLTLAIDTVVSGTVYLSPAVSRTVVQASVGPRGSERDPLSAREREVLQLVAEGRTNKEVAFELSISVKTVESHRGALMRKLGLHDTSGLVRYAIRRGLIEA